MASVKAVAVELDGLVMTFSSPAEQAEVNCLCVIRPLFKRASVIAAYISQNDPKRTSRHPHRPSFVIQGRELFV